VQYVESWTFDTPDGSFNELLYGSTAATDFHVPSNLSSTSNDHSFYLANKFGSGFEFDAAGLLQKTVDRNGNQTEFKYLDADEDGVDDELHTITVQGNLTTTFDYAGGHLQEIKDFANRATKYTIEAGELRKVELPDPGDSAPAPKINFTYDGPDGLLSEVSQDVTGRGTIKTKVDYDKVGYFVDEVRNADGGTWNLTPYLADGLATPEEAGKVRRASTGQIGNKDTHAGKSFLEARADYTDPRGNDWTYQTDAFGLSTAMSAPKTDSRKTEDVWRWDRNRDGLVTKYIQPAGGGTANLGELETEYKYDGNDNSANKHLKYGNLTKITYPQDKRLGGGAITENWEFNNDFGIVTKHTDRLGTVTKYDVDNKNGNIKSITRDDGGFAYKTQYTKYTTDANDIKLLAGGLLEELTDARGFESKTEYFTSGQKVGLVERVTSAVGKEEETVQEFDYYDERTLKTSTLKMNGLDGAADRTTTYKYDQLDRLIEEKLPEVANVAANGGEDKASPTTKYEYDETGFLRKEIVLTEGDGKRVTEYTPDKLGNVAKVTYPTAPHYAGPGQPEDKSPSVSYEYDENNNQTKISVEGGATTEIKYDQRNLVKQETVSGVGSPAATTKYSYDALGNIKELTAPNTSVTSFEYDKLSRETKKTLPAPGTENAHAAPVIETKYEDDGQVYSVTSPRGENTTITTTFAHDPLGRLNYQSVAGGGLIALTGFSFDAHDNLTSQVDPEGRVTEFTYDALDRKETMKLPPTEGGAFTITYKYHASGQIYSEKDSLNRETIYRYDSLGRLTEVETPHPTNSGARVQTKQAYDRYGNIRRQTDAEQNTTEFVYDALDRKIETRQANPTTGAVAGGPVTKFAYDVLGDLRAVTDARTNTTNYDYDYAHRTVKVTLPAPATGQERPATEFQYDASGNQVKVIAPGPNGPPLVTTTDYDKLNRPYQLTAPTGIVTTIVYDPDGQQQKVSTSGGSENKFVYDGIGRVYQQQAKRGSGYDTTEFAYYDDGQIKKLTDPAGNATNYAYNGRGQKHSESIANPGGAGSLVRTWSYDSAGRLDTYTDRLNRTLDYDYDLLDRKVSETWGGLNANGYVASYVYDLVGNLKSASDAKTGISTHSEVKTEYDHLYRPDYVEQFAPGLLPDVKLDYAFDAIGNKTRLDVFADLNTQQAGFEYNFTNTYHYDAMNRMDLLRQFDQNAPDASTSVRPKSLSVNYNQDSSLKSLYRYENYNYVPNQNVIATTLAYYQDNGRLQEFNHFGPSAKGDVLVDQGKYTYDPDGRIDILTTMVLKSVYDSDYNTTVLDHAYDAQGQLTSVTPTINGDKQDATKYDYDNNGNPYNAWSLTSADNRLRYDGNAWYAYDVEGNLTKKESIGNWHWIDDGDAGFKDVGTAINSGINGDSRTQQFSAAAENPPTFQWDFTKDALGVSATYLPAGTYRVLISWPVVANAQTGATLEFHTYDGSNYQHVGSKTLNQSLAPNAQTGVISLLPDGYESASGAWFAAEFTVATTNVTEIAIVLRGAQGSNQVLVGDAVRLELIKNTLDLAWDHRNRLTDVLIASSLSQVKIDYQFDVLDRLIARQQFNFTGNQWVLAGTEKLIQEGANAILHLDASNGLTKRHLWLPGMDQLVAFDHFVDGNFTAWTLADHQGTTRNAIYTWSGVAGWDFNHFNYDAFGRPGNGPLLTNYLYAGQYFDASTGLQYSRARWYDPGAHRFISQDPLSFAAGDTNLYRRVGNSPLNATDPTGQIVFLAPLAYFGVKLGVGAIIGYFATQAAISVAETAIEAGVNYAMGEDVSLGSIAGSFGKNFGINLATGGIGSKGKWLYRAGAWVGRQGIEIAGDTAYDVWNGKDFRTSLLVNSIGSVAGDAVGRGIAFGAKSAFDSASGRIARAYIGGFAEGALSYRPRAVFAGSILGGAGDVIGGVRAGFRRARNAADSVRADLLEQNGMRIARPSHIGLRPGEHHIATIYGKPGQAFQELFDNAGISMERRINKIRIPGHEGPHGLYNSIVYRSLADAVSGYTPGTAAYRSAFVRKMVDIRRSLRGYDGLRPLVTSAAGSAELRLVRGMF